MSPNTRDAEAAVKAPINRMKDWKSVEPVESGGANEHRPIACFRFLILRGMESDGNEEPSNVWCDRRLSKCTAGELDTEYVFDVGVEVNEQ